ncbi:MAG: TRAP transporter substrate-binding protein DctP, partial [Smithellaceae bacterium]|nr:TRAP transporter substrate-binding protein DctP [Smithellaceae bacterium]
MIRPSTALGILVTVLFLWPTPIHAQDKLIRLAVVTKAGSAQNVCAQNFKELLEARSPYRVEIHEGPDLGDEVKLIGRIKAGELQMGVITSGPFDAYLTDLRALDYPFLFENYNQVDRVLDGRPGKALLRKLEKIGLKGLAFSENGFRHLTNNVRPVHRAEDLSGLRIRVMQSALQREIWSLFGAKAVPLGWPITAALQKKSIDGQENPLSLFWNYDLYRLQRYLSLTSHAYSAHVACANLKWFRDLPMADQRLIRQAMTEAAEKEREWNRGNEAFFLKKIKDQGVIVDEKPDLASFRARVASLKDTDLFKDPGTRELLDKLQQA